MISPQDRAKEKKQQTESIIDSTKKILEKLNLPDYAKDIQLTSLYKRMEKLIKEKEEINRTSENEELILTLHPKDLPSGKISVRSLTMILGGLQNLSDSIANTLFNQPSEKGKIPQEILDFNEIIFKESKAGSFKAVLELKHSAQETFEDPVQSQTLSELFNLLYSSNDEESLSESIVFLGPRALKNYSEWTKSIRDLDTKVEIEWISSYKGYSKTIITPKKAENIYQVLSDYTETTEEEITLSGRLMGANVRTRTFEISTDEEERITGRITKDALNKVASFILAKKCKATLLKVTTKSRSKEKVYWTLKDIQDIEDTSL